MNVVNIGGVNGSGKKKKDEKKKSSSYSATTSGAKAKTSSSKSYSSTTKTGGGTATANTGAGRRTKTVGGSASAYTGAGRRTNTASQKTAGSGNTSKSTSSTTSSKSNNNFFSPGARGGGVKQNLSKYKNSKIYSKWEDMSDSDKEFAFRNSNSSANKWAEEASSVLSNAESHYSTYRKDTGKKSLDYQAKINRLISGGQYWKEQYKGNSDAVHKINSIMQALESGDSYVGNMSRYYSQFDNENSYKESQELNKLYNMSSSELEGHLKDKNPIAYTTLSGQNITWKNLYDSRTKEENFNVLYNNLSSMSDWEKMSQYRSTQGSGMIPFLPADAEHEWINDPVTKVSERTSDLSGYKYVANQMTDEERAIFNYLYNKSGKDRAYAFMDSIQSELKKRQENANIQSAIRLAKEVPVLPSVASFVTNLLSPIEYAYDALDYYVFGELTGRDTIDTNHAAALTSAIRGTVSENTDWMIGDWDAHDFLYSTAMSGVDSLIASGIYGIGGGISLGLSAAAQATNDALSKGQTNKQAFLSGLVSGVFESLWESVSIGKFKALKDVTPKSIKDVVKNIGKQMMVNASEEFNTEVANIVYDSLANGAFSDYESYVRAYMQSGMSESEARTKAASDLAFQTIEAAASGALMGAGFGGIGSIQGYINGGKVASDIYGSDPAALINESLEIDPNNTLALKLKEKLDKGKNISGMELNQLVQKNERTMNRQDTAAIQKAVSDRLTELGETGDIEALSIALTKRFSGKKLSNSENALIQNSQYGTRVSYEMNPTNIQSGDYASEWAENIGTNRINPEEYSRIVKASQITQDTQGAEDSSVTADTDFDAPARAQDTETASAENQDSVQPEIDEHAAPDVQEAAVPAAQTLEEASEKYGEQADAMLQTYSEGQDVDEYDAAYRIAYDMGESGIPFDYVNRYAGTSYLTADQRKAAYEAGVSSAATSAGARDSEIKQGANGKTGWKQGVVSGEGVTGDDLQKAFNMNSTQVRAYNILTDIAKATGLNIVLYKSSADKNGKLVGAQGKYNHSEPGTLYIDLNAGLSKIQGADDLGKYTMLRTFSHEFTHFIENWNPSQYNVLRKAVFEAIDERRAEDGLSAHELVMKKMDNGLSYEAASREVTAEALTDILPDANFVETLAQKHKSVFEMLRDKLKEFAAKIREYFENIGDNPSREARALKQSGHYVDSIVKLFDNVAVQAVENYQSNYAVDETSSAENSAESKAAEKTPSEPKAKVQAEPYVSENGYTITDNAEYGSIEVKFDSKPEQAVLDALKANKFRWHKQKQVWYGKAGRETIIKALDNAYASYKEALEKAGEALRKSNEDMKAWRESITPKESTEETAQEVTAPAQNDAYTSLSEKLRKFNRVDTEHFVFRLFNKDGKWHGKVDAAEMDVGSGIMVSNARGVHYTSEVFDTRQEAMDDILAVARNNKLLDERPAAEDKEVANNGQEIENWSDTGAIQQPVSRSEGASRLLEGVEPEAVRTGSEGRGPVRDGIDAGTEDAGRDGRTDSAGTVSERSTRDRVAGDLQWAESVDGGEGPGTGLSGAVQEERSDHDGRGAGRLGGELPGLRAEQLHEEVQQEIQKKSTTQPKGGNFVIGDSLNLPSGTKARVRANIDAIRLVKQIASEGRIATPAEQEILSKYVGWGGLADAFGKPVSNKTTRKLEYKAASGLEKEFADLKEVLTEEEYKAARESTKNAHYTSIEVIRAMYSGLKQMGFTGGRMLEPSSGIGNFVGAMPADMASTVKSWTMVELDNITGMIAKYLYPNADVRIQGFEEINIPDNYMDVAIGNVPFGNYAIPDKKYPKAVTAAIHNYFFAKALDKVRPGGIVMFITSSYTMNSRDSAVRKYMMQRADLLGAIRLPNTAFAGNAGTSVVTDILVLKKRADRTAYSGEAFEEANWERISQTGWDGAYVNEYFTNHPEMVLGTPKVARGMYSGNELTYDPFTDRGTLGEQITEAWKNITGKMDYAQQFTPEKANFKQAAAKKKAQKLKVKDGVIQAQDENGNITKVDVDADTASRITGMVAVRDAYTELCDALQQGVTKQETKRLRNALNKAYDSFVKQYGYLNAPKNKKAIKAFADSYQIQSLENYSEVKETVNGKVKKTIRVTKADIFSKDTIAANRTSSRAENVEEGLTISLNTSGTVDVPMIARLTGQEENSVKRQLIDQRLVFKDKDGVLIPAVQYLSGNVRAKLREMEGLVSLDSDYINNVEALRNVVPPTVPYTDIYVNPGANWIPVSVYEGFVGHILDRSNYTNYKGVKNFSVEYVSETNEYKVTLNDGYAKSSAQNTQVWAEGGKSFSTIFENMLNGRRTNVYTEGVDGKRVLDKVKTEAVAEKVEKLNEEFRKWLWSDETRRNEMQELYNEAYNALVTPKYRGSTLTVNGLNSTYSLRDHQKDAVSRIINSGGNTLLAHRVGAGKTMEMAAAAMKLKQLGVVKKPMFVVPNNVVAQWGAEFKDYFPAANILLVGDEDMTPAERMTTINKIKNNDYDAVILAYTKFEKIQMTKEWRKKFYEEQIDSLLFAINAEKENQKGKGFTVKQLEAKRKQLENKIKKLTEKEKDEDGAMFEDLGVDSLFVDEAHNFKNLEYSTRMNNVSGLGKPDGSQRAFDLYTKVRYLQQLNGGRGIVFATATPVMNSMTEMYIMQKYLQPDTLKQLGIDNFDSWAKMFGEVVNALEIKPSGSGYRIKQTFSKFKNIKALQQLFRSFTDVVTDIPGLKIPKMKGGKVQIVECEQSEFQKNYMAELAQRAENVKNVDPSEDNMLKITSDGRKISYSQRMIDPTLPYEEAGKIYKCCENVYNVYKESSKTKGTQMIFCDIATPKGKADAKKGDDTDTGEFSTEDAESAQLYDDMKARLVQLGIPENEIAFIHDAKNNKQKKELSEKMNTGVIRVLIGSTGKMGVGLNAQVKAVAIHHLDAPWRPGDIEQRDGRVFRQKNENEEAYKFVYVTKGSFDSRLWDILERKQKFINQIMNGDDVGNEVEDTGEVTLSAAEVKAVASDNPLIMEQVALEKEISKLESLQQAYSAGVERAKEMISSDERKIAILEKRLSDVADDLKARKDTYSDDKVFSIKIGKNTYTNKKDAGTVLAATAQAKAVEGEYTTIGSFAGFDLRVVKTREGISGLLSSVGTYEFRTYPLNTTYGINHLISVVESLDEKQTGWQKALKETRADLVTQRTLAEAPFEQADKLREKRSRYNEVMYALNPPQEQTVNDDTVQEQSRAYLSDEAEVFRDNEEQNQSREYLEDVDTITNSPVTQAISSAKTSIKQIPALFKDKNVHFKETNVDIGGGKFDLATEFLAEQGVKNYLFDPYNRSENINLSTLDFLRSGNRADTATCANVLNVIAEPAARANVILEAAKAIKNDGTAYFMVYEGDRSGTGRETSSGWQNNRKTADYVGEIAQYFNSVVRKGKLIIATDPVSDLPKAAWEISPGNAIQYQQRTDTLTDREVLALASSQLANEDLTSEERSVLGIFDTRIHELYELQEKRREQGRIYKEQQFGTNVDREEAEKTRNRMKVLDGQIERASSRVLEVENKAVLKRILQRARKIVEQNQREHDQAIIKRRIDRMNNAAAIRKYRTRIQTDTNELTKWVLHPNNKSIVKHIPDAIKDTVISFLESIDFTSKQQLNGGKATKADKEFEKQLKALKNVLNENINVEGLYSGYNDLPPNFMDNLQTFMDAVHSVVEKNTGTFVINEMSSEELHELSKIVRTLKKYIMDMNTFHNNAMFQHTYEAGDNSIEYMNGLKSAGNTGAVSNFLFWQQMRPAYAFERFGKGGIAIYDELRRGQAALAFNTKKIIDFSQNTYTEKEVKAWEKETHTFELGDDLVKIPVSGIMSLYELSKRPQGLQHILGGGIRVATYKDGKNKISDTGHTVTLEEVNRITETLTPRQKEVADALQKFMAEQGGEWGNYVSVKRFGESLFGEKNYFPINSDGRHLQAEADEKPGAASLYALLNMGFTKELNEKANNRVVLYSIFDVFANHMASMAQYNALALPVLDALKWFNYKQSDSITGQPSTSVRDEMNRVFGTPEETRPGAGKKGYAENFVINILKAYNGTEAQGAPMDSIGLKMLHKYNRAQVAFSFRVVVQQPLAITRAGMLIDYRSILRGMKLSPSAIRKNISEMQQYSGIAAWKSLGFYDVNISRGLTSLIKHDESKMDKFIEIGMAGAEKADTLTWAAMWSACKEEVMRKQNLKPGDNGFFEAVTELFENVIYKTQVVDSVLTKNEFIRDKGLFARTVGSFMSEPTTTASMLLDTVDKMNMDRKSGLSFQQTWKKNGKAFVRTVYVYAIGAILLASVQAAADALRDDDDYEDFLEKWLEAFKGDLIDEANPFNKLPILSDLSDLVKEILAQWTDLDVYGNAPNSVIMQWYDSLVKGSEIMHDLIVGNDTNYTWYAGGYKLLQALSGMTGVPLAAITREIASIWNTFVGAMAPSLKLKIYDGGEMNELKYAYKDGYLTDEEATALLLEKGLVDTEDEAYWKIQEWADSGDGFSKYDDVYDAVRNGGDFDAAMDELTSHGVSEKDALSEVKGKIGEWYKGGEVSKQQATEMLKKYTNLTDKEIASAMNKWSCVVVTGIPFDDIKDEYLAGNISASRAAEMYSRYGGYELGAARETVSKWNFESKYGYTYSEIGQRFRDGELSAREMLNVMTTYGGKTMEEAQSSLLNYVRDGYDDGIFSENAAINMMVQYCGVDQDKALNKVRYINIRNQFPNIEIDDHWVSEYYDEIEPYGISPEIFFNYRDTVKGITGEGKKQNRMAVIDSLPISSSQKDALYYAEGWAASRIYEAPWH